MLWGRFGVGNNISFKVYEGKYFVFSRQKKVFGGSSPFLCFKGSLKATQKLRFVENHTPCDNI
jgi:hypothetical protein